MRQLAIYHPKPFHSRSPGQFADIVTFQSLDDSSNAVGFSAGNGLGMGVSPIADCLAKVRFQSTCVPVPTCAHEVGDGRTVPALLGLHF